MAGFSSNGLLYRSAERTGTRELQFAAGSENPNPLFQKIPIDRLADSCASRVSLRSGSGSLKNFSHRHGIPLRQSNWPNDVLLDLISV